MIKIHKANLNNIPGLISLIQLMGYDADPASMQRRLVPILENPDHQLLVAIADTDQAQSQVVGFCHGYVRYLIEVDQAVELGGLAVAEDWQGQGVARQLVEAMEQWVKKIGQNRIVLASNIIRTSAHGFYEHLGYKKQKQQFLFEKKLENE